MGFVQKFLAGIRAGFCTKCKNGNLCRVFFPESRQISAQNQKIAVYADFFLKNRIFFLHKNAKLIFVQNSPAKSAQIFCTKLQNPFSCRIRQQNPPKSSAQKRKTRFRAEFSSRNRPNLLHKNAKLIFVQNSPAKSAQNFCTKTQNSFSCRIRQQNPPKTSAQKFKIQFRAEFRASGEGTGGGKPLKKGRAGE